MRSLNGKKRIPESLEEHFLASSAIEIYGTPRRLAVLIKGLPNQQPDRESEIKGPPKKAAYKDGQPTKAAEGFARKQGVDIADLELRDTPKGGIYLYSKKVCWSTNSRYFARINPSLDYRIRR